MQDNELKKIIDRHSKLSFKDKPLISMEIEIRNAFSFQNTYPARNTRGGLFAIGDREFYIHCWNDMRYLFDELESYKKLATAALHKIIKQEKENQDLLAELEIFHNEGLSIDKTE